MEKKNFSLIKGWGLELGLDGEKKTLVWLIERLGLEFGLESLDGEKEI